MANQDLLYSILPRPPAAPGSGEFSREVSHIVKEPKVKKSDVHPDPEARQQHHQPGHGPHPPQGEAQPGDAPAAEEDDGRIDVYI